MLFERAARRLRRPEEYAAMGAALGEHGYARPAGAPAGA
jgi:hypothetical protein